MTSEFRTITLKVPVDFINRLRTIASANNYTVNDTILEMLHAKITEIEAEKQKEIVAEMLKSSGGEIIKA